MEIIVILIVLCIIGILFCLLMKEIIEISVKVSVIEIYIREYVLNNTTKEEQEELLQQLEKGLKQYE